MTGGADTVARYRTDAVAQAHLAQQRMLLLAGVALALVVPVGDVIESGRDRASTTVSTHLFGTLLHWLGIDVEEVASGGSSLGESVGRGLGLVALLVLVVGLGLTVLVVVRSADEMAERTVRVGGLAAAIALNAGVLAFWVANQLLSSDEYQVSTAWGLVVVFIVAGLLVRLRRDHEDLS